MVIKENQLSILFLNVECPSQLHPEIRPILVIHRSKRCSSQMCPMVEHPETSQYLKRIVKTPERTSILEEYQSYPSAPAHPQQSGYQSGTMAE